jgi:hypothetical protein
MTINWDDPAERLALIERVGVAGLFAGLYSITAGLHSFRRSIRCSIRPTAPKFRP